MDDLTLLSRHLKEMDWLARPVVDPVTRHVEEMNRLTRALEDPMKRELEEMNRLTRTLEDPVKRELEEMNRLTRTLEDPMQREFEEEMNRLTRTLEDPMQREFEEMNHLGRWWADSVRRQIDDLQRMVRPLDGLSSALIESARWASSLVEQSPLWSSVAVLGVLPSDSPAGTLSYRTGGADRPRVNLGVWTAEPRQRKEALPPARIISLRCEVSCLICGEAMISKGGDLDLTITNEPTTRISVVPWCPHCSRRAAEDPAYEAACYEVLQELFEDRSRPQYRLLDGDGESAEPPRGRQVLALVKAAPPVEGGESDHD
jgi:hypothetical protein